MKADKKITHLEFIRKAVKALRKEGFEGIHTVYSGFNTAFREYYETDPIEATNELAKTGEIVLRPCRGGVYLLLKEDVRPPVKKTPKAKGPSKAQRTLASILS